MRWSGRAVALIAAMVLAPLLAVLPTLVGLPHGIGDGINLAALVFCLWAAITEVTAVVVVGSPALVLLDRSRVTGVLPFLALGAAIGLMTSEGAHLLLARFGWSFVRSVGLDLVIALAAGALGGLIYWTIARLLDRRAAVVESRHRS